MRLGRETNQLKTVAQICRVPTRHQHRHRHEIQRQSADLVVVLSHGLLGVLATDRGQTRLRLTFGDSGSYTMPFCPHRCDMIQMFVHQ